MDATKLKLEITESLLLHDIANIIAKIEVLKAWGVLFSLDDFGTGYSSLSYLKRLPIEQIKIDPSFVSEIIDNADDAAIACSIIGLAHRLGLDVIAEGVEAETQLLVLAKDGCAAYRGFLFGRPVPIGEFDSLFKRF